MLIVLFDGNLHSILMFQLIILHGHTHSLKLIAVSSTQYRVCVNIVKT